MRKWGLWLLLAIGSPAAAEVKSATANGFEVARTATVNAPPGKVYAAIVGVGQWWSSSHSYSGDAKNMTIEPRAGGCFCETVSEGGTVEHMRVVQAWPGRFLRLSGGLGPLQAEGVAGALTWTLKPVAGGTEISQSYVVGGYVRGGADQFAPIVDQVLGEQFDGLVKLLGGSR